MGAAPGCTGGAGLAPSAPWRPSWALHQPRGAGGHWGQRGGGRDTGALGSTGDTWGSPGRAWGRWGPGRGAQRGYWDVPGDTKSYWGGHGGSAGDTGGGNWWPKDTGEGHRTAWGHWRGRCGRCGSTGVALGCPWTLGKVFWGDIPEDTWGGEWDRLGTLGGYWDFSLGSVTGLGDPGDGTRAPPESIVQVLLEATGDAPESDAGLAW